MKPVWVLDSHRKQVEPLCSVDHTEYPEPSSNQRKNVCSLSVPNRVKSQQLQSNINQPPEPKKKAQTAHCPESTQIKSILTAICLLLVRKTPSSGLWGQFEVINKPQRYAKFFNKDNVDLSGYSPQAGETICIVHMRKDLSSYLRHSCFLKKNKARLSGTYMSTYV